MNRTTTEYVHILRVRTQTAEGRVLLYQNRLDTYRRCNPEINYETDETFKQFSQAIIEASAEFAKLYDELKALTWGKRKSLADSIKINQD